MRESAWKKITPPDSPLGLPEIQASPLHQDLARAKLEVGDPAHDFERPLADFGEGTERATGETFHLARVAAEKPVALIFGSYT